MYTFVFLGSIRYIFTPGRRVNSRMLYTVDEEQLYRRQKIHDTFDRFVCSYPRCRSVLNISKPGLAARRGNNATHDHPSQKDTFLKNRFMAQLKTDCASTDGLVDTNALYVAHAEKLVFILVFICKCEFKLNIVYVVLHTETQKALNCAPITSSEER